MLVSSGDGLIITHGATRLDNALDACFGGVVNAITEWEEGIRCHHSSFHDKPCVFGFDGGNASRVHTAHLTCTDADRLTVFGIDDGVGFDVFGDFPCKNQIVKLSISWGDFGNDF